MSISRHIFRFGELSRSASTRVLTGLMLIGRDGRSESKVNRISRFVFAVPTNERLEALRGPQIVATSSDAVGE